MWSRSKGVVGLSLGIGASWLAINKYGVVGVVEAFEKPPYPPQPYCIGKECPRTQWDANWDKKEDMDGRLTRRIMIVAHGQAGKDHESSKNKNAKPQKVSNKGKNVQVQKLPSDPKRFVKPKDVANDDVCVVDSKSGTLAADGSAGDGGTEGLSSLGVSQVKKFLQHFREEYGFPLTNLIIHGTDPPSMATAEMVRERMRKTRAFADVETTLLDPLTAPPTSKEPDGNPHPADLVRLEAVFRKYIHRIDEDSGRGDDKTAITVIVCPPNMVGYFVCRFLQLPPDRFTSWGVANASLTELAVLGNGYCVVQRVGDIGFMPRDEVTYE